MYVKVSKRFIRKYRDAKSYSVGDEIKSGCDEIYKCLIRANFRLTKRYNRLVV